MAVKLETKSSQYLILLLLAAIWGSSFILMKRGMTVFSPNQVAALRMFIAFVFLLPLTYKHIKKEMVPHWKAFLAVGFFGNFVPAFLFTKAETGISSSLAGMLNSLTPLFTLILGIAFFKIKVTRINVLGIIIGFAGALGLISASGLADLGTNINYSYLVVIATFFYGVSVNIIKKYLSGINSVTITVWAFTMVGPPAGLYLITTDFSERLQFASGAIEAMGYITLLAVVGTAIAVIVFNMLIKQTTALFASSVTYLIPIVAMIWGFADHENVNFMHFLCICIILIGVYMVNKKPKQEKLTV